MFKSLLCDFSCKKVKYVHYRPNHNLAQSDKYTEYILSNYDLEHEFLSQKYLKTILKIGTWKCINFQFEYIPLKI